MSNTYNIGDSQGQVSLEADITTIGVASSLASVLDVAGGNPSTDVAQSTDATGNIAQQPIGDHTTLKGLRLSVTTKIGLLGSDAPTRAAQAPNCTGTYILSGGDDGVKTFNNPTNTYIDPTVFLTFVVDLT
jgi:hypothetical protein